MRQSLDTPEDIKFRQALANMRSSACTLEDLAWIESRTVSRRPGRPSFSDPRLSSVSIITGLNAKKDKMNEMGSEIYARDTGQELTHFYSEHTLVTNVASGERKAKKHRKRKTAKLNTGISPGRQDRLWDGYLASSEHIPGRLSLCIGLPVLIRNNEATELCVTKGQEATVVGWQEGVGSQGQCILDTLFVELVKPPKEINIPGLPKNVVPLSKTSTKIWCSLPDDLLLQIDRQQVQILPNFAMTDYSSQGKSKDVNVVDLNNCKDHFSYYTALSRGTSSNGTIILQGIDATKITRGIHGSLRQEFRELEILNDITRLRYDNVLPPDVNGVNQKALIRGFQRWKGGHYEPEGLHDQVKWRHGDPDLTPVVVLMSKWQMLGTDKVKAKGPKKATEDAEDSPKAKKAKTTKKAKTIVKPGPLGLKWDSTDYSCSYDAVMTPLYHIWKAHSPRWSERFNTVSGYLSNLGADFASVKRKTAQIESARDRVRGMLHDNAPALFPYGESLTGIDDLALKLFGNSRWGTETVKCMKCGHSDMECDAFELYQVITFDETLRTRFKSHYSISHWLNANRFVKMREYCPGCNGKLTKCTTIDRPPPLLYFSLSDNMISIDPALNVIVNNEHQRYELRAVIYKGDLHFTCRIIDPDGSSWYHDGIETGARRGYSFQGVGLFVYMCEGGYHTRRGGGYILYCRRLNVFLISTLDH
ncbi:hypothetical protein B0H13DRAFT_1589380 [Mycena leptocephala]|nr:hypothetical protein B0H13DRAFT_1589380 [Mycena leptocephala]